MYPTKHTMTGAGPTSARFLTPTPVQTTYRGVTIPDHVRRSWNEALGRIWRRAVDATREAVTAEIEANINMRGEDLADGEDVVAFLRRNLP